MIEKIISGGQTGGDIAAWDVALKKRLPHGGWCPKGRKGLDQAIPARYLRLETAEGLLKGSPALRAALAGLLAKMKGGAALDV